MNKLLKILLLVLALTVLILSLCLAVSLGHAADVKNMCTRQIFYALNTLDTRLEVAVSNKTYSTGESEQMLTELASLDSLVCAAEEFYRYSDIPGSRRFADIADALGSSYAELHNNKRVESILFDGSVSEKELEFLTALRDDVNILIQPMLAEDGLNLRHDLIYDDIRPPLAEFLAKWGFWRNLADAPYELLTVE